MCPGLSPVKQAPCKALSVHCGVKVDVNSATDIPETEHRVATGASHQRCPCIVEGTVFTPPTNTDSLHSRP